MSKRRSRSARQRWKFVFIATGCAALAAIVVLVVLHANRGDAGEFLAAAEEARVAGKLDEAVIAYKNALQASPQNPAARWGLGKVYLALNQPVPALKELRKAYSLRAAHPELGLDMAKARIGLGQYREALAELSTQTGPRSAERDALEATAHAALGDLKEAQQVLDAATKREPQSSSLQLAIARMALAQQDFAGATAAVDKALAANAADPAALVLKGRIALADKQVQAAEGSFRSALEHAPKDADALAGLVETLLIQGNSKEAAPFVTRLAAVAPHSVNLRFLKGWLAYSRGDWASADTELGEVLRAAPTHLQALLLAADTAVHENKLEQAELHLREFNKLHPGHRPALRLLTSVLLKQRRAKEAVELLVPLEKIAEDDPPLLSMLSQAYFAIGDVGKGLARLKQAQALAPQSTLLKSQQALGEVLGGDTKAGLATLENLVTQAPEAGQPRQLLTYLQLATGGDEAALESAGALVKLQPKEPMAHNLLGLAEAKAGHSDRAREAFEAALKINPKFAPALANLGLLQLGAKDRAKGRANLEAAYASDRHYTPAALALAGLAEQEGRGTDADRILEELTETQPQAIEPHWMLAMRRLRAGALPAARKLADEALALAPSKPQNRLLWSYLQLGTGNAEQAYSMLKDLDKEVPGDPRIRLLMANAARLSKQPEIARSIYEALLKSEPTAIEPLRGLFALELTAGRFEAAQSLAQRMDQQNPKAPDGDEARGAIALQQGKLTDAITAFKSGFEKGPSTSRLLQLVELQRRAGDDAAASAALTTWLTQHPADDTAREYHATMAMAAGRNSEAIKHFEQILRHNPEHAVSLNNLAWLYDEASDPRALDYAERARKQLPDNPAAADTLGWILVRQGKTERGLALLEQAAHAMTSNSTVQFHYAHALAAAGAKDKARDLLDELLKKQDGFKERAAAQTLLAKLKSAQP